MAKRDYYEVLGVEKGADEATLKKAYRKLAMQHHPDRNPGNKEAEVQFKELNEAYDVLKDPQKRAAYDSMGHAAFEGGMGGAHPGAGGGFGGFSGNASDLGGMFEDLFGDVFGGGGRRTGGTAGGRMRGADLRYNLTVSLKDAFTGTEAKLRIPTLVNCDKCAGSGAKPGTKPETCATCGGAGQVRMQQGFFSMARTCPTCNGTGQTIPHKCDKCHGAGRFEKEKTLSVKIPAGVDEGTRIRLTGEGEAGTHGGAPGDLYIFISIADHDLFERHGDDVLVEVPVGLVDAILGGAIEVPTIDGGKVKITVPAGTQMGQRLRVKGRGMPRRGGASRGDMYVQVDVEIPTKVNRKQKDLLEKFRIESGGPSAREENFFQKVSNFWNQN